MMAMGVRCVAFEGIGESHLVALECAGLFDVHLWLLQTARHGFRLHNSSLTHRPAHPVDERLSQTG